MNYCEKRNVSVTDPLADDCGPAWMMFRAGLF